MKNNKITPEEQGRGKIGKTYFEKKTFGRKWFQHFAHQADERSLHIQPYTKHCR